MCCCCCCSAGRAAGALCEATGPWAGGLLGLKVWALGFSPFPFSWATPAVPAIRIRLARMAAEVVIILSLSQAGATRKYQPCDSLPCLGFHFRKHVAVAGDPHVEGRQQEH